MPVREGVVSSPTRSATSYFPEPPKQNFIVAVSRRGLVINNIIEFQQMELLMMGTMTTAVMMTIWVVGLKVSLFNTALGALNT